MWAAAATAWPATAEPSVEYTKLPRPLSLWSLVSLVSWALSAVKKFWPTGAFQAALRKVSRSELGVPGRCG